MKKTVLILGVESAKGVGKTSGLPYEFGNVINLTPVKNWANDKGKSSHLGFTVDPDKCAKCNVEALAQFQRFGDSNFPCFAEVDIDIDPEDMSKTIIVGATLVQHVNLTPPSHSASAQSSAKPKDF